VMKMLRICNMLWKAGGHVESNCSWGKLSWGNTTRQLPSLLDESSPEGGTYNVLQDLYFWKSVVDGKFLTNFATIISDFYILFCSKQPSSKTEKRSKLKHVIQADEEISSDISSSTGTGNRKKLKLNLNEVEMKFLHQKVQTSASEELISLSALDKPHFPLTADVFHERPFRN